MPVTASTFRCEIISGGAAVMVSASAGSSSIAISFAGERAWRGMFVP